MPPNEKNDAPKAAPPSDADLVARVRQELNYSPVIVFMGKAGVGKSSTCNALFGEDLFKVTDVDPTTREVQIGSVKEGELHLVDVPGVGEDDKHQKYQRLYERILRDGVLVEGKKKPVDAVVWLFQATDKALEVEHRFFKNVFPKVGVRTNSKRLILAINQADIISPVRGENGWNALHNQPGVQQRVNLDAKRRSIAEAFGVDSNSVVDFSASEGYNLDKLLDRIYFALPRTRRPFVVARAKAQERKRPDRKIVSSEADSDAWDVVEEVAETLFPGRGRNVVKLFRKAKPVIEKFFSNLW
jgi:predicted GTPase